MMSLAIPASEMQNPYVFPTAGGTYTWKIDEDIVCADEITAHLFDLPVEDAKNGLPIVKFLSAIHPDDLERVASSITSAIETGKVYREEYRVVSATGKVATVLAMGHCFRNADGKPVEYAGMLFDLCPAHAQLLNEEKMVQSCIAAFQAAKRAGNTLITYFLSMALLEIGQKTAQSLAPDSTHH